MTEQKKNKKKPIETRRKKGKEFVKKFLL